MLDSAALRKKYPKWAHRRAYHKKRRRRSRSRSRRRRRRARARRPQAQNTVTNVLLLQLLHQIMGVNVKPVARKHGENVISGYVDGVAPDRLAPVRARDDFRLERAIADRRGGARAGAGVAAAAAHAGGPPRAPMPS